LSVVSIITRTQGAVHPAVHAVRPLACERPLSVGGGMQARSALFDLYGDHLRTRGGNAPVAALVRLLACLDIAAPAVRTAVSRMVRQGWLTPVVTDRGRGYQLTERASLRLDEAAARIYRLRPADAWDGRWSVALLAHTPNRTRRERVQRGLEYLGYRQAHTDGWIAPRPASELESLTRAEGIEVTHFLGELDGDDGELVERLWHPRQLAAAYLQWLEQAQALASAAGPTPDERSAFAVRSRLVHEWRKFLFRDPGLPKELLPPDWPGQAAAEYFDAESTRLLPAASAYVDQCLQRRDP
jgi:phenylacetic acid degradation operon negative regulatory protein